MEICEKVKQLMSIKSPVQRSPEWFSARKYKVTASSAASLLTKTEESCGSYVKEYGLEDEFDYNGKCCNHYSTFDQFKLDKAKQPEFKGNVATQHGVKFEQIATDIYMNIYNTTVIEFGLLAHPTLNWLAASPDGITCEGRMLEIKCPYRRKITHIPLLVYWQQCQLQLEVCDLDVCDFFEVEIIEIETLPELLDDSLFNKFPEYKGCVIQIETLPDVIEDRKYLYPDRSLINNPVALSKWASETVLNSIDIQNLTVIETNENSVICRDNRYKKYNFKTTYWATQKVSNVPIYRDKKWFEKVKPIMKEKWDEILDFKKSYVPGEIIVLEEENNCLFS